MTKKEWREEQTSVLRNIIIKYLKSENEEEEAKEIFNCTNEEIKDLALLYSTYFFQELIKTNKRIKENE